MESEFRSHWCRMCGGSAHPATGCAYTENFVVCKRCTLEACTWIQNWTNSKGRRKGPSFYDSILASPPAPARE